MILILWHEDNDILLTIITEWKMLLILLTHFLQRLIKNTPIGPPVLFIHSEIQQKILNTFFCPADLDVNDHRRHFYLLASKINVNSRLCCTISYNMSVHFRIFSEWSTVWIFDNAFATAMSGKYVCSIVIPKTFAAILEGTLIWTMDSFYLYFL